MAPQREPLNDGGLVIDRDKALALIREERGLAADPIDLDAEALDRWAAYWETWQAKQKLDGDTKAIVKRQELLQFAYRTTDYEKDRRVDIIRYLLFVRGWPKWRIKRAAWVHWGVKNRTVENYVAKAREGVVSRLAETQEETAVRYVERLDAIIYDASSKDQDVIRAIGQVSRLLGLNKPIEIKQSDDAEIAAAKEALRRTILACSRDPEARKSLEVFLGYLRKAKDEMTP